MPAQPLTVASLNDAGVDADASASEHPHRLQLDLIEEQARNSWLSAVKGEEEDAAAGNYDGIFNAACCTLSNSFLLLPKRC